MKILHVINSLVAAGAEKLVVTLANQQVITSEVSLFTFYSNNDIFADQVDEKVNLFLQKNRFYFSLKKLIKLYQLMDEHDVIHVHLFPSFYIVAFLSFFFKNKKIIYTEHSTHNKRRKKEVFRFIEGIIYSRYDHVICISKGVETTLQNWLKKKINTSIIENALDNKNISTSPSITRKELNISQDNIVLVMVGRFQKEKDQDTIIAALKLLPGKYILLLLGGGEREKTLREKTNILHLEKRVRFLGIRKDVFSILKVCDYGILSSHWEGFGIVALEYIACGLIAIGTNVGGLRDVIGEEDCLFTQGDERKLVEILFRFENDKELVKSIKQKQKQSLSKYTIVESVKKHFDVYSKKKHL